MRSDPAQYATTITVLIEAVRDTIPPTTIPSSRVMLSMCSYDSDDEYGEYYLDCLCVMVPIQTVVL